MNDLRIAAIVEGDGETTALPLLVRRIAAELRPSDTLRIDPILRESSAKLLREGGIERFIELAARRAGPGCGILVLLDCDWKGSCPRVDGPALLARASSTRPDRTVSVVLANKEFESWFIHALDSIAPALRISSSCERPSDIDSIRGAKQWLSERMGSGRGYDPVRDQAKLCALMDLAAARSSDSFDKLYREVERLLGRDS